MANQPRKPATRSTSPRPTAPPPRAPEPPPSGAAVGITVFASIVLMVAGFSQALMGIVAIVNDQFFVLGAEYVFAFDTTTWGWIHLVLGVVVGAAGFGLFTGRVWARTVGVVVAIVSIIANFLWMPFQPFWSILLIVLAFYVIWALTGHGRDITRTM